MDHTGVEWSTSKAAVVDGAVEGDRVEGGRAGALDDAADGTDGRGRTKPESGTNLRRKHEKAKYTVLHSFSGCFLVRGRANQGVLGHGGTYQGGLGGREWFKGDLRGRAGKI